MRVRPVDPRAVTPDELADIHTIRTAVLAHDEPDRRRPSRAELAAELAAPWPGTRTAYWLSRDLDGQAVGLAALILPAGADAQVAHVDLAVLPPHRRRGVGHQLMREAIRLAYSCNREQVLARTADAGPGLGFAHAARARAVQHEVRSTVDLTALDPAAPSAIPEGYDFLRLGGDTPPERYAEIVAAHRGMADAPQGESGRSGEPHDAERIAAFDRILAARGLRQLRVLACHRGTGEGVGITYVIVPRQSPQRSQQGDTAVTAAHRGAGLARALKSEALRWLRAEFARVVEVTTWVDADNAAMRAVNRGLGYRDRATYTHWQLPVADLTADLGMR